MASDIKSLHMCLCFLFLEGQVAKTSVGGLNRFAIRGMSTQQPAIRPVTSEESRISCQSVLKRAHHALASNMDPMGLMEYFLA